MDETLASFLAEERIRTLRRDGELVRRARARVRRRWRPAGPAAPHDDRMGRCA